MAIKVNEVTGDVEKITIQKEHPTPAPAGEGKELTLFPNLIFFKDVGRAKACFTHFCKDQREFFRLIGRHFMSSELEFEYDGELNKGWISFGGFRVGGTFYIISEGTANGQR